MADLEALALRVGTVLRCVRNEAARQPAYKLWIDLGDAEPVQSSAKIVDRYLPADLVGRQVIVVTGFAPLRVGGFRSEVLVLGALTDHGVMLLRPDDDVPPGSHVA